MTLDVSKSVKNILIEAVASKQHKTNKQLDLKNPNNNNNNNNQPITVDTFLTSASQYFEKKSVPTSGLSILARWCQ